MGLARIRPLRRPFHPFYFAVLTVPLLFLAGLASRASAESTEVECTSLRLQMQGEGYDNTCEVDSTSDYTVEYLEANSADGSHFLVVIDHMTTFRYIFRGNSGLQNGLKDYFTKLTVDKWKSGGVQQGLRTGEFVSDFKSIPSDCVAFERYLKKEAGGWRRRIIGFGCSRTGDREQVYAAMRHVNFPE